MMSMYPKAEKADREVVNLSGYLCVTEKTAAK